MNFDRYTYIPGSEVLTCKIYGDEEQYFFYGVSIKDLFDKLGESAALENEDTIKMLEKFFKEKLKENYLLHVKPFKGHNICSFVKHDEKKGNLMKDECYACANLKELTDRIRENSNITTSSI